MSIWYRRLRRSVKISSSRLRGKLSRSYTTIIRQNEVGDKLCIIVDGAVDVLIEQPGGSEILVNQMQQGEYFGEMAPFGNNHVRTATVRASADSPVSVVALDYESFNDVISDSRTLREELANVINERLVKAQTYTRSAAGGDGA